MIGNAIFSELGHDEAMVLIWNADNPPEHVSIGLLLMGVQDYP